MSETKLNQALTRIDTAIARLLPINRNPLEEDSLLRLVIDTIPAMIWVKRVGDGLMIVCNDAAAEMGGTTRRHMEGTFPERWWPPGYTKKWLLDDQEVAALGHPKRNILEQVVHPKSNQMRWLRTSKYPIIDDDGRISAILVFAYDVTEIIPPEIPVRSPVQ